VPLCIWHPTAGPRRRASWPSSSPPPPPPRPRRHPTIGDKLAAAKRQERHPARHDFRRFRRSSRLPASAPMVTAPTNNSPRASAVSFGNGVCVLAQPNALASAIRHVASRPMYVSQSRSAPAVARNRSRSGGDHRVSTVDQNPHAARRELRAAAQRMGLRVALDERETGKGANNDRELGRTAARGSRARPHRGPRRPARHPDRTAPPPPIARSSSSAAPQPSPHRQFAARADRSELVDRCRHLGCAPTWGPRPPTSEPRRVLAGRPPPRSQQAGLRSGCGIRRSRSTSSARTPLDRPPQRGSRSPWHR